MKLFISWSGTISQIIAEKLREWVPTVLQSIDPWLASRDIPKGSRWQQQLSRQLEETHVGIVCITRENLKSPWILFEVGALSKAIDESLICLYLIGITPEDLPDPLAQFNATVANKSDTRKLLQTLNSAMSPRSIENRILDKAFNASWRELDRVLKSVAKDSDYIAGTFFDFGSQNEIPLQVMLSNIKKELRVSGNDCKFVVDSKAGDIEALLKKGVKVKVICVDPESEAPSMLGLIDPRFNNAGDFKESMKGVERILKNFKNSYPHLFDYRLLPVLPAFGLFITDSEDPRGVVRVEIYASKPWEPTKLRPRLLFSPSSKTGRSYFLNQWNNYWDLGLLKETMQ